MNINRSTDSAKYLKPFLQEDSSISTRNLRLSDTTESTNSTRNDASFFRQHSKLIISMLVLILVSIEVAYILVAFYSKPINKSDVLAFPTNVSLSNLSSNDTQNMLPNQQYKDAKLTLNSTFHDEIVAIIDKSPWSVRFVHSDGNQSAYGCTGSLIKSDVILTAAHCFIDYIIELHIGGISANNHKEMIKIPRSEFNQIIHPDYSKKSRVNNADIGIIKLKASLNFSQTIQPLSLPFGESKYPEHFKMNEWTTNEDLDMTERTVHLVNNEKCHEIYLAKGGKRDLQFYKDGIKEQVIFCAETGYVFRGNSGGAVIVKKGNKAIALGILSMGGSGKIKLPSVFIDIRAYLEWIFYAS